MSVDLAWAAGLFDGEGSACARRYPNGKNYLHLKIAMTDEDVVRRFYGVAGFGSFIGPYRPDAYKDHWKSQWVWQGTGVRAKEFALQPWFFDNLGSRRRGKILEIVALQDGNPNHIRRITDDPDTGEASLRRMHQLPPLRSRRCKAVGAKRFSGHTRYPI